MKLFITTCLTDDKETVYKLFKQADIAVFSSTNLTGFKNSGKDDLLQDWFASGEEHYNSFMVFSFTSDDNARKALAVVKNYNEANKPKFLLRAFIIPVEDFI